jgi:2,4-dienoyl-CoA reductase (NADPH2)
MHTGLEEEKSGFERMAAFYAERARGEAGLIVTGGIAPNRAGWVAPFGAKLTNAREAKKHKIITKAVHDNGGHICMQILHTGRYAYHPFAVAPSKIKSPITPFTPKALSQRGVEKTIKDFVKCSELAKEAGYDGVEIMGSEGYLINQFISSRTNKRTDQWGGSYENRMRFPLEILRRVRAAVGEDFVIIYRLSMLDLVDEGSTWEEVVQLAKEVEKAGATVINTGIGWHEARVPTIATMVPRAGFAWVTKRLMGEVNIPLITTNRINEPQTAEQVLADGCGDMVSMARPFLADPDIVAKSREGKEKEINTCIACNQACLDHVFKQKTASCLVNPRACHETMFTNSPTQKAKNLAIVGAGPSGLTCAITAAQRGHKVTLFERRDRIGGQFLFASKIPGKEEFKETLRYYETMVAKHGVKVVCGAEFNPIQAEDFDDVILSSGVIPRVPDIKGVGHEKVLSYPDVLSGKVKVGKSVAIIGAGGIGFDMAAFLGHGEMSQSEFEEFWGISRDGTQRGGLTQGHDEAAQRTIYMLKRSPGKAGKDLGKTTGWIHRQTIKKLGVQEMSAVEYLYIDDQGLHIKHLGEEKCLEVDHIVICAGQLSDRSLEDKLRAIGKAPHVIGGALEAGGIDAKRAIEDGYRLGLEL